MKLFDILFFWIGALAFTACSSDLIDEPGRSGEGLVQENSITLRVANPEEADRHVSDMIALVFDRGVRVGMAEWNESDGDMSMTVNDLRVGSDINIYVIANTKNNSVNGVENDSDNRVMKSFYNEQAFLNAYTALSQETGKLMKKGSLTGYRMLPSDNEVEIALQQVAAWIEFASLTVNFTDGDETSYFRISSVELKNVQNTTFIDNDTYGASVTDKMVYDRPTGYEKIEHTKTATGLARFFTFANQDAGRPVILVINGEIHQYGASMPRSYEVVIQDAGGANVCRGHKYEIKATLSGKISTAVLDYAVVDRELIDIEIPEFK